MTTAIVSSTGISGSEAGTAIKGVLARLYRIGDSEDGVAEAGKTEEFLNNMGIAVRKSATEFRSMGDILGDIQKRWNTMSTTEKSALSQQIAGVYHYSKFIALMDNYEIAIDATNKALDSNNSAAKENEKYLDSIAGKTELFKVSLEELYGTIISSNGIKNLVEYATDFVNVIDRVVKYLGGWNIALIAAEVASIAFAKTLMGINAQLAIEGTLSFGNAIKALIPAFFGATAATGALNTQLIALNALTAGIPILIGAIVIGTMAWANSNQKAIEKQKESNDALQVATRSYEELENAQEQSNKQVNETTNSKLGEVYIAQKLSGELDKLSQKENKSILDKTRMKQIVDQLNTSIPNLNLSINSQTGALNKQKGAIDNVISAYRELILVQAGEQKAKDAASRLIDAQLNQEKAKEELNRLKSKKTYNSNTRVENGNVIFGDPITDIFNQDSFVNQAAIKDQENIIAQNQKIIDESNKTINAAGEAAKKYNENYGTTSTKTIDTPDPGYFPPTGDDNTDKFKAEALEVENLTDALIASANARSKLTQAESDHIERQIKIADKAKDYNKELELQNQLIESQTTKIKDLDTANDKIGDIIKDVKSAESERANGKGQNAYDISSWFTADGGSAGVYEQIVAKLEQKTQNIKARSGDEHQKQNEIDVIKNEIDYIKDLYDTVSKLKKAYSDNEQEVVNIQDKIDATQADIVIKKIEIASRNSERAMVPLNNEMEKLNNREKNLEENDYQGHIDVINSKIRVQEKVTATYDKALKDLANSTDAAGRNTKEYGDKYRELLKNKKESIQLTEEERQVQEDYLKERDKALVDYEKQKAYDELESKHKAKLKEIEQSLYGQEEDAQYKWEEANKAKIVTLQTQLDLMKQKNEEASEEEERQQKLLDIEKQKQKIANIESEKNVRLYQNGKFEWVADPRKLREENSTLQDMETSFTQWETENNQKHNEEALQNQIDTLSKMSDEKQKAYDKMAKIEDDSYKKSEDKLNETYKNMDQVYQIHWNNVYETAKGKIDEIEKYETDAANRIKDSLLSATQKVYDPNATGNNKLTSQTDNGSDGAVKTEVSTTVKTTVGKTITTTKDASAKTITYTDNKTGKVIKTVAYDTGGYTGDGEGLAYLHSKELILNKVDTFNVLKVVETVKDMMSNVKLPSFNVPQLALASGSAGKSVTNYNTFDIGGVKTNDARSLLNNLLRQVNK